MDPSTNHRSWAERSGEFSPAYYARLGENKVSRSLVTVFEHFADEAASILEIGCSSGRHLAHLRENGFERLTGIDINEASFEVMADHYPALAETGTFHTGPIERVVPDLPDDAFDAVYSVETLQHVHPDEAWVFEELARVTSDLLVTVENEGPDPDGSHPGERVEFVNGDFPLYRRNWNRIFGALGLTQHLYEPGKPNTIRVFRTSDDR